MSARSLFIMSIDDDPDDLDLFLEAIKEIDTSIQCLKALDGEDALAQLAVASPLPDIIFLDINMPRMDGKRCLSRLKEDVRFKDIPVIMHSTSFEKEDTKLFKSLGADILLKQVDYKNLVKELTAILDGVKFNVSQNPVA